jgi:hypothetical protein
MNLIFRRWATGASLHAIHHIISNLFYCCAHTLVLICCCRPLHRCGRSLYWTETRSQVITASNKVELSAFPTIDCIIRCSIVI